MKLLNILAAILLIPFAIWELMIERDGEPSDWTELGRMYD